MLDHHLPQREVDRRLPDAAHHRPFSCVRAGRSIACRCSRRAWEEPA